MTLISRGKPVAVLVTPDMPQGVEQYAARELAWHLEMATGARPEVATESNAAAAPADRSRIYLGKTKFAERAGVSAGDLELESCIIRTVLSDLVIAGRDGPGVPLDPDTSAGTLFGVYELLENYLGVRWLWPGDLGTAVPRLVSLVLPSIDQAVAPQFAQRRIRPGTKLTSKQHPALGFSASTGNDYSKAQSVFLRRHRMGRRAMPSYGHAFTDWWLKYGTEHPEWFQLVNGRRGPTRLGRRCSMCVSNQELRQEVVKKWEASAKRAVGSPGYINAVENDIPGLCECDVCRSLDGPEPSDYRAFIPPTSKIAGRPFVTDRYAHFWRGIQEMASKNYADATVVGYAYFNYFAAPTSGIKLGKNILVGFCPSGWWYPRNDDEHEWMKRQWTGWSETGASLFMRTNYFLDGYCMPYIFVHQFADDFQNAAKKNMFGTDFDSLTGQWATQGPTLYLMLRMQTRPDTPADKLLKEYYSGFGPAGDAVEDYFRYWETFTRQLRPSLRDTFDRLGASRWRSWAKAAHAIYPEECFARGQELLQNATKAASPDAVASKRVEFLALGLQHAKLCSRAAGKLSLGLSPSEDVGRRELEELIAFRRSHENLLFSNLNYCAWVEEASWRLGEAAADGHEP